MDEHRKNIIQSQMISITTEQISEQVLNMSDEQLEFFNNQDFRAVITLN